MNLGLLKMVQKLTGENIVQGNFGAAASEEALGLAA
jgi:hypothetical protein